MDSPPTFAPTAYGNFDPSQWSNPYSLFQNQALPWPSQYAGAPTDAMGNPIASYQAPPAPAATPQGTTLNTSPMGPNAPWNAGSPAYWAQQATQMQNAAAAPGMDSGRGFGSGNSGPIWGSGHGDEMVNTLTNLEAARRNWGGGQTGQGAAQAGASAPPNNWGAALSALANPGKVTTPGATVPQGAAFQPGPGVLQHFLANWSPAQQGPGSQFQQIFANALPRSAGSGAGPGGGTGPGNW